MAPKQPNAGEILRRSIVHRLDAAQWLADECNLVPDDWQASVLRERGSGARGARVAVLAVRQSGKSQIAAGRAAHTALFKRDKRGGPTTSLIACPAERRGQLLVARAAELLGDHVDQRSQSRVVLKNGAQIIALPMSNDAGATARGYTVSGILICDEFGFLPNAEEVLAVVSPMTTIHGADMMLISSASYDGDLWHSIVIEEQGNWSRYKIAVEDCPRLTPDVLDDLRGQLGPALYAREMLNQFSVSGFSPVDLHAARAAALTDDIGIDIDVLMGAA